MTQILQIMIIFHDTNFKSYQRNQYIVSTFKHKNNFLLYRAIIVKSQDRGNIFMEK